MLFGYAYARDSATGKLLLSGGLPTRDPVKRILGNVNPDWTGGWANEFRYKSVALNVLVDFRRGGQNFSVGNWWGQYAGILESTLKGREVDWDKPGLVIDGIDKATKQAEHGSCHGGGLQPHRLSDQRSRHLQHRLHQAARSALQLGRAAAVRRRRCARRSSTSRSSDATC